MQPSSRFQFSLANLLMAMVSLAIMFGGIVLLMNMSDSAPDGAAAAIIAVFGIAAAGGSLFGGPRGLSWTLGTTVFTLVVIPIFLTAAVLLTWGIAYGVFWVFGRS